ncbi:MAG TPA: class I SAM-dependent methyltransferase [Gammaproteobacteria bacterium]
MQKHDAWARFWRTGSLTSFGDRFSEGYQGGIRALWTEFFASLPEAAIVADLGAGNGALEEIAQKHCAERERALVVHAFDLAPELPARFRGESASGRCAIEWHPATANEATGLDDSSVDAVTGNYAFEYGDAARTIAEIARILKPGGKCRFLMHHVDSNIIRNARSELALLDAELEKGGFLDAVRDYLREFGDIRKPAQFEKMKQSGRAEPWRRRMNETHQHALQFATTENVVVLIRQVMQWTGQLVSPPVFFEPKAVLLDRLKQIRQELSANRSRLRDMQAAAIDQDGMNRIVEAFRVQGMTASAEPFFINEEPATVGWRVSAERG